MTAQTILPANTLSAGGFDVANSVRFNSADSASMEKDAVAPTDNNKWTFSAWVKRSKFGGLREIFYGDDGSTTNYCTIRFNDADNTLTFKNRPGSTTSTLTTTAVFRDPSAWYHLVVVLDTSNGTTANRDIIYINGVREANFSTENHSGDGDACYINNNGDPMKIAKGRTAGFFDGYMSEVVFIDGLALAADSFGEFDEDSGIWKPIDVSGLTFGNNGFYLDFKASSNLGNDANGGTDLGETNLAATDQSTDTCTNNFATLNPLIYESRDNTFAEGALKITGTGSDSWTTHYGLSTIAVTSGKWFVEAKVLTVQAAQAILGLISTSQTIGSSLKDNGVAAVEKEGRITGGGNNIQTSLTAFANNDIAGIAFDATNGTVQFYRNGSAYGDAISSIASDTYYFATTTYQDAGVVVFNFGSPPYSESGGNSDGDGHGNFSMAVPSGYFALNTKNLAEYG